MKNTSAPKVNRLHYPLPGLVSHYGRAALVMIAFGVLGVLFLTASRAATYANVAEAESAVISGNALKEDKVGASNGAAVIFGAAAPKTPTNLVAYTGGESIAIRWDTPRNVVAPGRTVQSYSLYRNNVMVKSVEPVPHNDFPEVFGRGYIDYNIQKGQSYAYSVRVVDSTGAISAPSTALTVLAPTGGIATPTINVDTSLAQDLAPYVNNTLVPLLKVWYPKLGNKLALPNTTPPNTFSVFFSTTYPEFGHFSDLRVGINPVFMRKQAALTHGSTKPWVNMLQGVMINTGTTPTAPEWARVAVLRYPQVNIIRTYDYEAAINGGQQYNLGKIAHAQFVHWIQKTYDPAFFPKFLAAVRNNTSVDTLIQASTGKTLAQLDDIWLRSRDINDPPVQLTFKAYANKCLYNDGDGMLVDLRAQIRTCGTSIPFQFVGFRQPDNTFALRSGSRCASLELPYENVAKPNVFMEYCDGADYQLWSQKPDGSIVNVATGKCITTPNGTTTDGTGLIADICDSSAKQLFSTLPDANIHL